MSDTRILMPIGARVAAVMIEEIEIMYAKTQSDHIADLPPSKPLRRKMSAVDDDDAFIQQMEKSLKGDAAFEWVLKGPFDNLIALVEARGMASPKPGEREFRISECLNEMESDRKAISAAVFNKELPQDCLELYTSACSVALAKTARTQWSDKAREKKYGNLGL